MGLPKLKPAKKKCAICGKNMKGRSTMTTVGWAHSKCAKKKKL